MPRVAWFSPLPVNGEANASPSAYATETLLPYLSKKFQIHLFHDSFEEFPGFKTNHYLNAFEQHKRNPFDLFFYQIEDHARCNFVRTHMGVMPGIVWFHDFVFSTDGPEPILNSPWSETVQHFSDPRRAWPERGYEFERPGPLGYREGAYAQCALFSNVANHGDYQRELTLKLGEKRTDLEESYYLPFPVEPIRISSTAQMGSAFEVLFAGTPRIEHRAHKLLEALHALQSASDDSNVTLTWLIDESESDAAKELLAEFEVRGVELVEGRSPQKFRELLATANVAVHTLFSVYGQPGPYLEMSLMAGTPVVVTNFASCEELPDSLVFKIRAGESEATEIQAVLQAMVGEEVDFSSNDIREYAEERYSAAMLAEELGSVFRLAHRELEPQRAKWEQLEIAARQELLRELGLQGPRAEVGVENALFSSSTVYEPAFKELGWSDVSEKGVA